MHKLHGMFQTVPQNRMGKEEELSLLFLVQTRMVQ